MNENLKRHLENLHTELTNVKFVDEDSRKLLENVMVDVRLLLSHPGDLSGMHHAPVRDRLAESARHFDTSHPSLASTIRTVVHTLNTMGI
jgi:hypothetical protein